MQAYFFQFSVLSKYLKVLYSFFEKIEHLIIRFASKQKYCLKNKCASPIIFPSYIFIYSFCILFFQVKSGSMSTGIVARAKNALKMDPDKPPKTSSTGPIHLNTSSNTSVNKKSSSLAAAATSHNTSSRHNTKSSSSSSSGGAATVKNGPPSSTSTSSSSAPTATASKKPSNSTQVNKSREIK